MADEKEAAPAAAAEEVEESGGGNKLVLILTGVNVVISIGMMGLLFYSFQKDEAHPKVEDIAAGEAGGEHGEAKEEGGHGGGGGEHGGGGHGDKKDDGHGGSPAYAISKTIKLETFTINLATVGSARPKFARVNISLEVPTADTEGEVQQKMPQVRNVIIDLFNSKKPADLATAEGRNFIREEIRSALNSFLVTGKVKEVFFTNFVLSS